MPLERAQEMGAQAYFQQTDSDTTTFETFANRPTNAALGITLAPSARSARLRSNRCAKAHEGAGRASRRLRHASQRTRHIRNSTYAISSVLHGVCLEYLLLLIGPTPDNLKPFSKYC